MARDATDDAGELGQKGEGRGEYEATWCWVGVTGMLFFSEIKK